MHLKITGLLFINIGKTNSLHILIKSYYLDGHSLMIQHINKLILIYSILTVTQAVILIIETPFSNGTTAWPNLLDNG